MLIWLAMIFMAFLACFVTSLVVMWSDYKLGIKIFIVAVVLAVIFLIILGTSPNSNDAEENKTTEVIAVDHEDFSQHCMLVDRKQEPVTTGSCF